MVKAKRTTAADHAVPAKSVRPAQEMSIAAIDQAFARLAAANPTPKTELHYSDAFTLLVAVVLSAQATDVGVNKATKRLFADAATPAAMLALGEAGIRDRIRTLGLFNSKAKNLTALCRQLLDRHQGRVPPDRASLEALPGVGRKTANVVLNTAFGWPTIAVDTHIFRVANRTGMARGATVLAVEKALERRIAEHWRPNAHHWLILHGRYCCKARKPDCPRCCIAEFCGAADKIT